MTRLKHRPELTEARLVVIHVALAVLAMAVIVGAGAWALYAWWAQ